MREVEKFNSKFIAFHVELFEEICRHRFLQEEMGTLGKTMRAVMLHDLRLNVKLK